MSEDLQLIGGTGNDVLTGADGNDRIYGGGGNDQLSGAAGNDYLYDVSGADIYAGGAGDDRIVAQLAAGSKDTINGGTGIDQLDLRHLSLASLVMTGDLDRAATVKAGDVVLATIKGIDAIMVTGTDGADILIGASGADRLDGQGGADTISAGTGDDIILARVDGGRDVIDGGSGNDQLALTAAGVGYTMKINGDGSLDAAIGGLAALHATGIERVAATGSDAHDVLVGLAGDDVLTGGGGADSLMGNAGRDMIVGGSGDDTANGGDGDDTLHDDAGDNVLAGANGDDSLYAGSGNDTLSGGNGNDVLSAGDGDDMLIGGAGNDTLVDQGGAGQLSAGDGDDVLSAVLDLSPDVIDGGSGSDQLFLAAGFDGFAMTANAAGGIDITMDFATVVHAASIEQLFVIGSEFNDTLLGLAGDDVLNAGNGEDGVDGGAGNDQLDGGYGADRIMGGSGDDSITDALDTGDGAIDGGSGNDLLHLDASALQGFVMAGALGSGATITASGGVTAIKGIEAIDITASAGDDRIVAGAGADRIDLAGIGADTVVTSGGDDHVSLQLDGRLDRLDLGAGTDGIDVYGDSGSALAMQGSPADLLITLDGSTVATIKNAEQFQITGGSGDDLLFGGDLADVLAGGSGANSLTGGGGDDVLDLAIDGALDNVDGGDGNDILAVSGAAGPILMTQTAANAIDIALAGATVIHAINIERISVIGSNGIDGIVGLAGNDFLSGGDGNDVIDGRVASGNNTPAGADMLYGGAGDDIVYVAIDGMADQADGGAGNDSLRFASSSAAPLTMSGNLQTGATIASGGVIAATVSGFESIVAVGGGGNDILFGGSANDTLVIGAGADQVAGGAGNDRLFDALDGKADSIDGGAGSDTLTLTENLGAGIVMTGSLATGASVSIGGVATATVKGIESVVFTQTDYRSGNDLLLGGTGADTLILLTGADQAHSGAGDDHITAYLDTVQDIVDGGAGTDLLTVNPGFAPLSMSANASGGVDIQAGGQLVLTAANIERLEIHGYGSGNDSLIGLSQDDQLFGSYGNDTLAGGAGSDYLVGDYGDDVIDGGDGNDVLIGGHVYADGEAHTLADGKNMLSGGAGDDIITGGLYDDRVIGGTGNDTIDLGGSADILVFDAAPGSGIDQIAGFYVDRINNSGYNDRIEIDHDAFGGLQKGQPATVYQVGIGSQGANAFLVYQYSTGILSYDADAAGPGGGIDIAHFTPNTSVITSDITVI